MVFICRSAGRAGATKVQLAERRAGRNVIVEHIGTAHDDAELAVLMKAAQERLYPGQDTLDLGLADVLGAPARAAGVITSKRSALLWEVLTSAYARLGFEVLGDEAFKQLVLARLEADHVAAWSKGGDSTLANCEMLCVPHNRSKGNR